MTKKSDYLHIRIDGPARARVMQIAHSHGMTMSEYVRAVVTLAPHPHPRRATVARDEIAECIDRNLAIAGQNVPGGITRAIAANIAMGIDEYGRDR